ncbi:MAG: hypothetical protein E6J43_10320 [Chloroflexi bacterium]|nr:MAG: hypothetical protein E6J43_10320 [Chloroflexota bacterium]
MESDWRSDALKEIGALKRPWIEKYAWSPCVDTANPNHIDLYIRLSRPDAGDRPRKVFVLRLRYEPDFRTAGRREQFVNAEDWTKEGVEYWPTGVGGILPDRNPPVICLEGTCGFHSDLHRDRDGRRANLNKLLLEIQRCLSQ